MDKEVVFILGFNLQHERTSFVYKLSIEAWKNILIINEERSSMADVLIKEKRRMDSCNLENNDQVKIQT